MTRKPDVTKPMWGAKEKGTMLGANSAPVPEGLQVCQLRSWPVSMKVLNLFLLWGWVPQDWCGTLTMFLPKKLVIRARSALTVVDLRTGLAFS